MFYFQYFQGKNMLFYNRRDFGIILLIKKVMYLLLYYSVCKLYSDSKFFQFSLNIL